MARVFLVNPPSPEPVRPDAVDGARALGDVAERLTHFTGVARTRAPDRMIGA